MPRALQLKGQVFGTWEALHPHPAEPGQPIPWTFKCTNCPRTIKRSGAQVVYDHKKHKLRPCLCARRAREAVRRAGMYEAFLAGDTYVGIGRTFRVSKQRVQQFILTRIGPGDAESTIREAPHVDLIGAVLARAGHASLVRIMAHLRNKARTELPRTEK